MPFTGFIADCWRLLLQRLAGNAAKTAIFKTNKPVNWFLGILLAAMHLINQSTTLLCSSFGGYFEELAMYRKDKGFGADQSYKMTLASKKGFS